MTHYERFYLVRNKYPQASKITYRIPESMHCSPYKGLKILHNPRPYPELIGIGIRTY